MYVIWSDDLIHDIFALICAFITHNFLENMIMQKEPRCCQATNNINKDQTQEW